jgi:hypothetical protein
MSWSARRKGATSETSDDKRRLRLATGARDALAGFVMRYAEMAWGTNVNGGTGSFKLSKQTTCSRDATSDDDWRPTLANETVGQLAGESQGLELTWASSYRIAVSLSCVLSSVIR